MDLGIDLPEDLNTEINKKRWLIAWNGNLEKIQKLLGNYIRNRKAARFTDPPLWENFLNHPYVRKAMPYARMSVHSMMVNEYDNTIVMVNRLGDLNHHHVALSLTSSELILFYFSAAEFVFQQVLEQERRSGEQSGVTLIYDYENLHVLNYVNPYSACMQIFSQGALMLQEYYCHILKNFYLVNCGGWLKPLFQIVKAVLNPTTLAKVHLVSASQVKEVLRRKISLNALPVIYGGEWSHCDPMVDPRRCTLVGTTLTEANFIKPSKNFPDRVKITLQPKKRHNAIATAQAGDYLRWQFVSSAKVSFAVTYTSGYEEAELLFPRIVLCTPHGDKLPEEGAVYCEKAGVYSLEFSNVSHNWFSVKVEYTFSIN